MITVAAILIAVILDFIAGVIVAYVVTSQESHMAHLRLQAEINALRARDLPPRVLEVWFNHPDSAARLGVYFGSIDADLAVDALALVGAGTRAFSDEGMAGVLSRREVARLRRELIQRGMCNWHPSGRSQGIIWTNDGAALLETCKIESARTHAHALPTAKRHTRRGVGEVGNYA
jgi:hypothetical protein